MVVNRPKVNNQYNLLAKVYSKQLEIYLPRTFISKFKSKSQISRVVTEKWAKENLFCPNCGNKIVPYPANTKVYDFYCSKCPERFQLKSSGKAFSKSILGAEYKTTLRSLRVGRHPSLILLHYDKDNMLIKNISILHRACITASCLRPRKPLSPSARRHGWQGCLYLVDQIPKLGLISIVNDGRVASKNQVIQRWQAARKFLEVPFAKRGWLADLLTCIDQLYTMFTLHDVYQFEDKLAELYPSNRNVKPKIRQQLQQLRDLGIIEFLQPGMYRRLHK